MFVGVFVHAYKHAHVHIFVYASACIYEYIHTQASMRIEIMFVNAVRSNTIVFERQDQMFVA